VYPGPRVHLCKEKSSGGTVGLSGNECTSGTPIWVRFNCRELLFSRAALSRGHNQ
jgi:hypothetical protein